MRNRKKIKASPPPALRPFIPWPKEHLHHRLFSPGGEGDGPGSDGMRVAFSPPQPFSAALPCFIEPCPGLQPFRNSTLLWSSPWPQLLQEIPPFCAMGPPQAAGGICSRWVLWGCRGSMLQAWKPSLCTERPSTWAQALLHSAMEGPSPSIQWDYTNMYQIAAFQQLNCVSRVGSILGASYLKSKAQRSWWITGVLSVSEGPSHLYSLPWSEEIQSCTFIDLIIFIHCIDCFFLG